ncbi:MAG TPA: hypothetical protein VF077_03775 [Nitrospiraceae bacterium]
MPKKFEKKTGTPESRIKKLVKERLIEIGAYQFWPVQMGLGAATLDCLVCFRGRFHVIETKRPGKKPTARQEVIMEQIRAAGGTVHVIDNETAARELFTEEVAL